MTNEFLGHDPTCHSYLPGHQLHWSVYKLAAASRAVEVSRVVVNGTSVEVMIDGEPTLHWLHHDPKRMTFALEHSEGRILASPDQRALRIDGYWFSCAPQDAFLSVCG